MDTNKTETEVSTKARKDAEPVKTALVINWEGMTPEEVRAMAQQALIVKVQGKWREDGIPAKCELKAVDYKVGVRAPRKVLSLAEQLASLTPEQKAELLVRLQAEG